MSPFYITQMHLKTLRLVNFRGYKELTIDFDKNLNVIIGKNDIGKSTILEALDIFFGQEKIKLDISDKNVYQGEEIIISCAFEIDKHKEYLIDTDVKTNLADEFLLNHEGYLEIKKVWDCSKDRITATCLKTFIVCNYPSLYSKDPLPTLKIGELKQLLENETLADALSIKINRNELSKVDHGLEINFFDAGTGTKVLVKVDKRKRAEIRKAIYSVTEKIDLKLIDLPIDKEDGKNIWSSIESDLPLFFLFQSDRANKDTDKEVQDPLKVITKRAIETVSDKLEEVRKLITESAEKIGNETIKKLEEMNPELSKVLRPDVSNKAWDSLFSFSFIGDDNIPMNKRGSGVRRLILLNYFRAEAERQNTLNKNIIYAIEEPETSQHPNHQALLIDALNEISKKINNQVIITTHSPEIAKQAKDENLILIDKVNGESRVISSEYKLKSVIDTLGITTYLGKLVICVEGENDINFLTNINQSIPEFKGIIDLKEKNIKIIPMQGSSLINWVDRHYLSGSNVIEFHLYDRDSDNKYESTIEKINCRQDLSMGLLTKKREMENYIHPTLYYSEFNVECSNIKDWDNADIPEILASRLNNKKDSNIVKQIANGRLSKHLTKDLLIDLNCFEEVESWFKQIKLLYEK